MKKKLLFMVLTMMLALVVVACSNDSGGQSSETADGGEWSPSKAIEFVAPSAAGGGWDTTARMSAKVLNEAGIIDKEIGVVNKTGGGGAVGWAYMASKEGNAHHLFVGSVPLLLVPLNGQSEYDYSDFTPLANLIADYGAFAVREDAKWNDLNELFEDMKENPESITVIGESSPGSMDHIQFVKLAKAAGVDITKIKYISDQDGGTMTQLLNGSVDVYSTGLSETVEQVRAGNIRVLGITAPERLEGEVLEDFPTAIEQGIDEEFINWRGFFGPPNMTDAEIAYYEAKFKELSDSPEFAEIREQFGWNELFMGSKEYKEFLDNEYKEYEAILDELGLKK